MNVILKTMTPNPLELIYTACRQCYSADFADKIYDDVMDKKNNIDSYNKMNKLIKDVLDSGHHSVLEHVYFTFFIEDVSRICTHQLVRHRLISPSQQSLRYVTYTDKLGYYTPRSIKNNTEALNIYNEYLKNISDVYNKLISVGVPQEDARSCLPLSVNSNIIITLNIRELIHFFGVRCCTRAQHEIRDLANRMLKLCKEKLPEVFLNIGPKCKQLGYCPESIKRTCGLMPHKSKYFGE